MASQLRRIAQPRRWRRTRTVLRAAFWSLFGLIVLGFATLNIVMPADPPGGPTPAPTSSSIVGWTWEGTGCSNGWPAWGNDREAECKGHGGLASIWRGNHGEELRCDSWQHPPQTEKDQRQELADEGHLHCLVGSE